MTNPIEEKTLLQQWQERSSRLVTFDSGFQVRIALLNELAILFGEDGMPNPLLDVINRNMGDVTPGGEEEDVKQSMQDLLKDPKKATGIRDGLRQLLLAVVIDPPLKENGHPDGVSVDVFPLDEQLIIFQEIFGGQLVDQARSFPEEQTADLDITSG